MAVKTHVGDLFSMGDIATIMGMSGQALSNRAGRDENFPKPTHSNINGTVHLYTAEDLEKIIEHMTKADRERVARLEAALTKAKGAQPKAGRKPAAKRGATNPQAQPTDVELPLKEEASAQAEDQDQSAEKSE